MLKKIYHLKIYKIIFILLNYLLIKIFLNLLYLSRKEKKDFYVELNLIIIKIIIISLMVLINIIKI